VLIHTITKPGSWHFNRSLQQDTKDRRNLIPVFGCLRDARSAYFLSYDGKTFKKRIFPKVRSPGPGATQLEIHKYIRESFESAFSCSFLFFFYDRGRSIFNLKTVHQYTFVLLLEGFVNATGFYHKLSVRRTETGDVSAQLQCYSESPASDLASRSLSGHKNSSGLENGVHQGGGSPGTYP
jgi:hypothetical protein